MRDIFCQVYETQKAESVDFYPSRFCVTFRGFKYSGIKRTGKKRWKTEGNVVDGAVESVRIYVSYVCIRWCAWWRVLFAVHMTVEEEPLLDEEYHHGSDTAVDLWYMLSFKLRFLDWPRATTTQNNRDNTVQGLRSDNFADLAGCAPRGRAATIARGMQLVCLSPYGCMVYTRVRA